MASEKDSLLPLYRRIVILGFRAVGKSNIVHRQTGQPLAPQYVPTITSSYTARIKYRGRTFNTEIIDTAGLDEFSYIASNYLVGVDGYILVYSICSRNSFEMIKILNDKLLNLLSRDDVPRVLVGNKVDLESDRVVSKEEGEQLARQWKAGFLEASARRNYNINQIFQLVIREIDRSLGQSTEDKTGCCQIL